MNKTLENINNVKIESNRILEKFNIISQSIEGLVGISSSMYNNSKIQENSVDKMLDAMSTSSKLVENISTQIEDISEAVNQQNVANQDTVRSIENLSNMANETNEYLIRFKTEKCI